MVLFFTVSCYITNILARFDLPVLAPYLFPALKRRYGKLSVLKKQNLYFSVRADRVTFKDILLFSSPCSLSKYLKQNDILEEKSIFPYSYYSNVTEIEGQIDFPPYEAFYSELKKINVDFEEYEKAKAEFYRRKGLPSDHPDKMNNFKDWLIFYNNLDVLPLAKAIENSFKNFFEIFKIDPEWCISLPKYAQMCMFSHYDPESPYCYSFCPKNSEIRRLFRSTYWVA